MATNYPTKENADKARTWVLVDAGSASLGRVAARVASILRGKHKTTFSPHVDCGDFVVVVNAANVKLTGNKMKDKVYFNYSGYIGGMRERTAEEILKKEPQDLVMRAVKGMLPSGPLGRKLLTKLKVYSGSEHPHKAQTPSPVQI